MGIIAAFQNVKKESDRRRPQGKDGTKWTSRVQWEEAKRIDPALIEEDVLFQDRTSQDEIRQEMEREANLLNAKAKIALAAQKGKTSGPEP